MLANATAPEVTNRRPEQAQEYLGRQLRRLRESRGMSRTEAGARIGGSDPKVSRIELGRNRVKDEDLLTLLSWYGVNDPAERDAMLELSRTLSTAQWWHSYSEIMTDWFSSYLVLDTISVTIRTYEPRFIPGLLQTRAYAEHLVGMHFRSRDIARRRVDIRVRRQQILQQPRRRRADNVLVPRLWAVIDESALHERIGPATVMLEQIDALLDATRNLRVRIQILPSGTAGLIGVGNSFSMLRLSGQLLPDVVYLEHLAGAHFLKSAREIEPYRVAMESLGETALEPRDAVAEFEKAKRRLRLM